MEPLYGLYLSQPFWLWAGVGAAVLGIEVATGSGYLLWPAGSAAAMAVLALFGVRLGLAGDLLLFAILTLVTTLTARRFWPNARLAIGADINDPLPRLIGHHGQAAEAFQGGRGRVFVDGKEWAAEAEDLAPIARGERIEVMAVLDGARLMVRAPGEAAG